MNIFPLTNAQIYKSASILNLQGALIKQPTPNHQMPKVETTPPKNTPAYDDEEKNDSETHEEETQRSKNRCHADQIHEIEYQMLPLIFKFNYAALQRIRLKKAPNVPQLAYDIFDYLKDKLVVRRYSEGGKFPNRMKYQEKVKFLMRAFDHRRAPTTSEAPKRREKFNRQKQLQFFTRPEVREHFLEQIKYALVKKKAQNQRRIRDMEDCIEVALEFLATDPAKAQRVFEHRIKRKQLPWTDNMFMDIEDFSKQLFQRFSGENLEAEKQTIAKQTKYPSQLKGTESEEQAEISGSGSGSVFESQQDGYILEQEQHGCLKREG